MPASLARANRLTRELLGAHHLTDDIYAAALDTWGEARLVELLSLIGYFAGVCWLMKVARMPGPQR